MGAWRRWWRIERQDSLLTETLVAWHVALIGSLLLVILAHELFAAGGAEVSELRRPVEALRRRDVVIALLLAPLIETVILGLLLTLLARIIQRPQWLAVLSAVAWGAAHASFHPLWFFGTVWSFYVFSRCWLAWQPVSYKHAFAGAALPHALVNSSALLMQFFARS